MSPCEDTDPSWLTGLGWALLTAFVEEAHRVDSRQRLLPVREGRGLPVLLLHHTLRVPASAWYPHLRGEVQSLLDKGQRGTWLLTSKTC